MASLPYTTLDVFTSEKYAGNPLAVVKLTPDVSLTQAVKQTIAREFNYSETVFLHLPSADTPADGNAASDGDAGVPEWQLDIFTVEEELPFAGHPTIGAAVHVLSSLPTTTADQEVVKGRFRIKAGILDLSYNRTTRVAKALVPHNVHIHTSHTLTVQAILDKQPGLAAFLKAQSDCAGLTVEVVSPVRGMNFGMVQLPSLEALATVSTTGVRVGAKLDADWDVGPLFLLFYVRLGDATNEEGQEVVKVRTRMIEGSFEDPATGSASCGLAALIALQEGKEGKTAFEMVQAVEMGRRSEIGVGVEVVGGKVERMELSGKAVEVMEGRVFYE